MELLQDTCLIKWKTMGGGTQRSSLAYDANLYFLNYRSWPHHLLIFTRDWLLAPLHTPPNGRHPTATPPALPQLSLASCQGQGVFQRQSLASPGQSLETSVSVSACLTSKVNQLRDATTSDFYEMRSALCIAFDLRRDLHTLIRPPYHPCEAAMHLRGTQVN